MGARLSMAIVCCVLGATAARAQNWQALDVRVDLGKAPELVKRLRPLGLGDFAARFITAIDRDVLFWRLQPAAPDSNLPVLTAEFSEFGSGTVRSRRLLMHLALRSKVTDNPFYESEDLQVIDQVVYANTLMLEGDALAAKVVEMARKRFRTEFSAAGEKKFCEVPVVEGVHQVLGDRIVVPLEWDRVEGFSASQFSVEAGGQSYQYKGAETSVSFQGKLCLVLQHCPPPPHGPPLATAYKRIKLVERHPHIGAATAESNN